MTVQHFARTKFAALSDGQIAIGVMPATTLVMAVAFAIYDPRMISTANLLNVVQQTGYITIFALAQTIVMLVRGFDLSLGPTVSMVSVACALSMTNYLAGGDSGTVVVVFVGLLSGVAAGILIGAFNGGAVAFFGVNPFIATLGSYNIAIGIATTISGGRPVQDVPGAFSSLLYGEWFFGVPSIVVLAALLLLTTHFILRNTVFGRSLYMIGHNPRAVEVAGRPVRKILLMAYIFCSVLAAIGAMALTARTGSGEPNLGGSLSLQAIAAAVVGGASLKGGVGGVGTALLGALFVTVLSNGMNFAEVNGYMQMIVLGTVIVAGVALDRSRNA